MSIGPRHFFRGATRDHREAARDRSAMRRMNNVTLIGPFGAFNAAIIAD